MSYQLIKYVHITAVSLSIFGFTLRGIWMLLDSPLLNRKWVKTLPHIIDTILLVSAITLIVKIQQYPFVHAWLTVKTLVLLLYIFCGMVALNYGKTKKQRAIAFMIALISFAYIVLVALSKTPVPV